MEGYNTSLAQPTNTNFNPERGVVYYVSLPILQSPLHINGVKLSIAVPSVGIHQGQLAICTSLVKATSKSPLPITANYVVNLGKSELESSGIKDVSLPCELSANVQTWLAIRLDTVGIQPIFESGVVSNFGSNSIRSKAGVIYLSSSQVASPPVSGMCEAPLMFLNT